MNNQLKKQVLNFLQTLTPKICSLATVSSTGQAQCAVMGYIVFPDLSLVLNTHLHTRKWANLTHNPKVALTFGWLIGKSYLQCEGSAKLVFGGKRQLDYEKIYFIEHPDAVRYKEQGKTGTIRIKPSWFRFYNYSAASAQVREFNL